MRRKTLLTIALMAGVLAVYASLKQRHTVDVSKPGPQAGTAVPAFTLPDQHAASYKQTRHLDVATYTPDGTIAPGSRFSVVAQITPHKGIHVYAPGASSYQAIELKILPTQYVQPRGVSYPPSEIYAFEPLNERVPTYQKPFTLVQEVVLDGRASTRTALRDQTSLTIGGRLTYQACDDRLCYDPVSVPLSWTVGLEPIVTGPTARPATK